MKVICRVALSLVLFFSLAAVPVAPAEAASSLPAISVKDGRLLDDAGRQVVLRGVNAGGRSKLPPFYPFEPEPDFQTALTRYADGIASFGFNVVRLIVIYEAAEPVRGQYDEEYLKKFDAMVEAFAARGIYIIVDSHQDVFSRRFCGDGFPDWAIREKYRGLPQHEGCRLWNVHYFSTPALDSFNRLYENDDGLRDSYAAFFKMLAERYKNEPAVIGFEPMNEPMPGSYGLIHYTKWYEQLFALYEAAGQAVHAADPRYLIFADLCPLENQGAWNTRRPRPRVANLVLAPHYYDLGTFSVSIGKGLEQRAINTGIARFLELGRAWNTPVLFSEYGISPLFQDAPEYINMLYSAFDAGLVSGTFWEASVSPLTWGWENTSIFEPDGSVRPRALALDRPYPRAVAGNIESFSFDPASRRFELTWSESVSASAATEIYAPPRLYGNMHGVTLDPPGEWSYDAARAVLRIAPLMREGQRRVAIAP
ncbi:MAG TPA: cellulase family glycosylhydrolase [bacterium]|nr:cellulase family glycosylhydrolase [bacterium]